MLHQLRQLLYLGKDKRKTDKKLSARFRAVLATMAMILLICITAVQFNLSSLLELLELKTYDLRVSLNLIPEQSRPSSDVMIVEFDDPTLYYYEEEFGTWPWPRSIHADMIRFMNQGGARMIAYDILFISHRKDSPSEDQELINTFLDSPNVYLGMNLDQNYLINQKLGRYYKTEDVQRLHPMQVTFQSEVARGQAKRSRVLVDSTGFPRNPTASFSNFRPLMQGFYKAADRLYILNHDRDTDGISRSNPLLFRLTVRLPEKSNQPPFVPDRVHGGYVDQGGHKVDANGNLLDEHDMPLMHYQDLFLPHISLRMISDLRYPDQPLQYWLTQEGCLQFGKHCAPLTREGNLLVHWYNVDRDAELAQLLSNRLSQERQQLSVRLQKSPDNKALRQQYIRLSEEWKYQEAVAHSTFQPKPFQTMPAWKILRAVQREKLGQSTQEDKALKALFRNKIIFVGTTAVSSFDMKNTPLGKMPGVYFQASLFDTLYQNKAYIQRIPTGWTLVITLFLCSLASFFMIRMRTAVMGLLVATLITLAFIVSNFCLFKLANLWLDLAAPVVLLVITMLMTYVVKYVARDRDYQRTYQLATTDSMTGLFNHRYFQEHLRQSIEKADRSKGKFSLILIDIDFFKKFNDSYGHQAGDEVLRCVARKLQSSVRAEDMVARYGGEEMAVILDRANEEEALKVGEKLVRLVAEEAYPIAEGVKKHVTISVGVSTYPNHGNSPQALIEFSDQGLYRAKKAGRNRVGAQFDDPDNPLPEEVPHH